MNECHAIALVFSHYDHAGGNNAFKKLMPELTIYAGKGDNAEAAMVEVGDGDSVQVRIELLGDWVRATGGGWDNTRAPFQQTFGAPCRACSLAMVEDPDCVLVLVFQSSPLS